MKKRLSIVLALVLLLVSVLGTTCVFAEKEYTMFIDFYRSLGDCEINAISTKFDAEYAIRYYASDESPEFLDEDPFEYELTDEKGTVLTPDADGTWTLGKGSYKLRCVNMDEIKERLKEWEYYDTCRFEFPDEEDLTINITVDGERTKFSMYARPSTTLTIDKEAGYVFDSNDLYIIQFSGLPYKEYFNIPSFLLSGESYTFDVKVRRGAVLTEEELIAPMKEGSYILTWNNMDEIKKLVEESDAEFFDRYTLVFPDEPLTSVFDLKFNGSPNPKNKLDMYSSHSVEVGDPLPSVERLLYVSDKWKFEEEDAEWLSNVQIEYYDESGRKLEENEINGNLAVGKYIARWVNFDEFLAMDIEKGWGLQNKYKICGYLDEEYPECVCEVFEVPEYDFGSVIGNGTLTVAFGCTTLICLVVIAVLAIKLKKAKDNQ